MVVSPGCVWLGCVRAGAGVCDDAVDEGLGGAEVVGRVGEAVDGGGVEVGGDRRVLEEGFGEAAALLQRAVGGVFDGFVGLLAAEDWGEAHGDGFGDDGAL